MMQWSPLVSCKQRPLVGATLGVVSVTFWTFSFALAREGGGRGQEAGGDAPIPCPPGGYGPQRPIVHASEVALICLRFGVANRGPKSVHRVLHRDVVGETLAA